MIVFYPLRDVLYSYYTMTKTNAIIGLVVLVAILTFFNFSNLWGNSIPDDLNEMTAWQLLDIKIDYDDQIQQLKDKRQEIIDIYNIKRWRVETWIVETWIAEEPVSTNIEWNNLGL